MSETIATEQWDLEIKPQDGLFNLHLKDVWNYRDLLWLLVRRDFVSFYKQTILGPLWFFVQPLLTTLMFTLVFGKMGGFSTDGLPPASVLYGRDYCLELFCRLHYQNIHCV